MRIRNRLWALAGLALMQTAMQSTILSATIPADAAGQSETVPADEVLVAIGRKAGLQVLAESSIARERVRKIQTGESITAANVEQWIAWVVKQLPPGSNYAKLYLPPPPDGVGRETTLLLSRWLKPSSTVRWERFIPREP